MTLSIDMRPEDFIIVTSILRTHLPVAAEVFVFGSRAVGTTKRASDLDLAIDVGQPLTHDQVSDLAQAFEECDLPYKVDLVDLQNVSDAFKALIINDIIPLELDASLQP